jgi:hypothetical protein
MWNVDIFLSTRNSFFGLLCLTAVIISGVDSDRKFLVGVVILCGVALLSLWLLALWLL